MVLSGIFLFKIQLTYSAGKHMGSADRTAEKEESKYLAGGQDENHTEF